MSKHFIADPYKFSRTFSPLSVSSLSPFTPLCSPFLSLPYSLTSDNYKCPFVFDIIPTSVSTVLVTFRARIATSTAHVLDSLPHHMHCNKHYTVAQSISYKLKAILLPQRLLRS